MRVKCLAQEHKTISPVRAQTQAALCANEHTNHEATVAPPDSEVQMRYKLTNPVGFMIAALVEPWLYSSEVTGSNPIRSDFFSSFTNFFNCYSQCNDH